MRYLIGLILILLTSCTQAIANERKVIVAANASLPPYVIPSDDSGIQLEILKAAFNQQGLSNIEVRYMSNLRAEQELLSGKVDVALNFPHHEHPKVYKSDSLLSYQNVAVSLASRSFHIDTIYDLQGKSIVAFQHATAYLEKPYKAVVDNLLAYDEVVNQEAQITNLMKGWVDVIVLERRIFIYYLNQYAQNNPIQPFRVHAIFAHAPRPGFFKSESLRDAFNAGLQQIVDNGQYHAIMKLDGMEYAAGVSDDLVK